MWEYSYKTKQKKLIKDVKLQGGIKIINSDFEQKIVYVPGHDGVEIPMLLMHKKGLQQKRRNKTLMEVYGCYGLKMSQAFSILNITAMERGFVVAHPYVRGGGEKGVLWHEAGKLEKKPNSIKDFISCAEYLVAEGITHPNLLTAKGSSAGATLAA